jgi:hypothetical protein
MTTVVLPVQTSIVDVVGRQCGNFEIDWVLSRPGCNVVVVEILVLARIVVRIFQATVSSDFIDALGTARLGTTHSLIITNTPVEVVPPGRSVRS